MAMSKPKTVAEIPADELKRFGASLVGTGHNVYTRAMVNWGEQLQAGDELFDRLKAEAGVQKCEECNEWKYSRDMDRSVEGFCFDCVEEMNGTCDEDE